METVNEFKDTLRRHVGIKDWQGMEIIVAAAVAHYLPGEMLWLKIIGVSRSGKTEVLRAIAEDPDCVEIEAITPASLRGSLRGAPKLLDRINGKLVIDKDISAILTARKDVRNEIFGLLPVVKDGMHSKVPFTYIVAKDMVTGNNPGAVLLCPYHRIKLVAAYGRGRGADNRTGITETSGEYAGCY